MKRFLRNILLATVLTATAFLLLTFIVPIDHNTYYAAYEDKLKLAEETPSPRVMIMGSSFTSYGVNSQLISDSLGGMPVINLGHLGDIGARWYLEDYLKYIRPGDVVVVSPNYSCDFINRNGYPTSFNLTTVVITNHLHNLSHLSPHMWRIFVQGIPLYCKMNIERTMHHFIDGTPWQTPKIADHHIHARSGFEKNGDYTLHMKFQVPIKPEEYDKTLPDVVVSHEFIEYMKGMKKQYEQRGARMILLPEIITEKLWYEMNPPAIVHTADSMGLHFATPPEYMLVSDTLVFTPGNTHLGREGNTIVSKRIATLLKKELNTK